MPRLKQRPQETPQQANTDEGREPLLRRLPTPPLDGISEAGFIQMAGTTCMALGGLLVLLSGVVEPIANLGKMLGNVGMGGGTLVLSGLILHVLGRLRRGHVELAQRAEDRASNDQMLEQMATEVLQLSESIGQLETGQARARKDVQTLCSSVDGLAQTQAAKQGEDGKAHDAIFRLAASLDQLGAKVEQRMQTQYEAFRARLREVGDDIVRSQREVNDQLAQSSDAHQQHSHHHQQHAQPQQTHALPHAAPTAIEGRPQNASPTHDIRATAVYEAAMSKQFGGTPSAPSTPAPTPEAQATPNPFEAPPVTSLPRHTEVESPLGSLGVLDSIEDDVPMPQGALPASTETDFAPSMGEQYAQEMGQESPAPATPQPPSLEEQELEASAALVREKSPVERAAELDTRTKLHQLNDLLEDRSLREMLENIKRGE